jgi:hypothetical protein
MPAPTRAHVAIAFVIVIAIVIGAGVSAAAAPETPTLRYVTPTVDVAALLAEDAAIAASGRPHPLRFAAPIDTALTTQNAGEWTVNADGSAVWRLEVSSPDAFGLTLGFARFDIPDGAALEVLDSTGARAAGPYHASDRNAVGGLWTPMVRGDDLVLELHTTASGRDRSHLLLSFVGHAYREIGAHPTTKQESCNIDAVCPQGDPWRDQIRAAGMLQMQGSQLCSGQMVNNTAEDNTPYFLTAEHCFSDAFPGQDPGQTAATAVVYWNYQSPTCGAVSGGSLSQSQSGAALVASSPANVGGDFALMRLDDAPDPSFNVYFAGWDATGDIPAGVVGIHHPNTDEKALSFDNDPGAITNLYVDNPSLNGQYYRIGGWDEGLTEFGSSGSCIYDNVSGLCIGTLTGGDQFFCPNIVGNDWYSRTSVQWAGGGTAVTRLRDWLDPLSTGALTLAGKNAGGSSGTVRRWLIPAAASTPGVGTSNWKTQLHIVDPTASPIEATVHFVASGATWPGTTLSGPHTVAANGALLLDDPLAGLNPTSGLLWVELEGSGGIVSSRTFNLADGDVTFGQGIPGILLDGASSPSSLILPLANSIPNRFRVNLGLVAASSGSWAIQATAYSASGTILGQTIYPMNSAYRQVNDVFANLGLGSTTVEGGWIRLELVTGSPSFWTAYLSVIDAGTDDPTYVAGVEE